MVVSWRNILLRFVWLFSFFVGHHLEESADHHDACSTPLDVVEVVAEHEITIDHGEELPGGGDDRQEVAVEDADGKEHEYLSEAAGEPDVHAILEKGWICHNAEVGVFAVSVHLVAINQNAHDQPEAVIGEHAREGVCALAILVLLVRLSLGQAIKQETHKDEA